VPKDEMAKSRYPKPRKWAPKNPEKYAGDVNNIIARSGLEIKFMNYCDNHPSILQWASEELKIPYISPADGRHHSYHVDFILTMVNKAGEVKKYFVEIKPDVQTRPPVKTKGKQKRVLLEETLTYAINQAKWKAATEFGKKKGFEFIVVTEKQLGGY
jgi:hypothetical protein